MRNSNLKKKEPGVRCRVQKYKLVEKRLQTIIDTLPTRSKWNIRIHIFQKKII